MSKSTEGTNRDFAKSDELFKAACELAGVEPTKRQASKFRRKTGLANLKRRQAAKEMNS